MEIDGSTLRWVDMLMRESACTGAEVTSGILQVIFGPRRLVVQSTWRLIHDAQIIAATDSSESVTANALKLLHRRTVDRLAIQPPFHDLSVHFTGQLQLQTFADSEMYEHWYLWGGPQEIFTTGPGQHWSVFRSTEDPT